MSQPKTLEQAEKYRWPNEESFRRWVIGQLKALEFQAKVASQRCETILPFPKADEPKQSAPEPPKNKHAPVKLDNSVASYDSEPDGMEE